MGSHKDLFRPQDVRSYIRRMSLYNLGTRKNLVRLITVQLVMYCLCCTFSIFFCTMSHSNSSTGIHCFLVNHGIFPFTNSSHPYLNSRLMSLDHLQNSMLYTSYQPQNEDSSTELRASTPAAIFFFIYDYLSSLSFPTEKLWTTFL